MPRVARLQRRAEQVTITRDDWGVPHVWLVDPERRTLHVYNDGTLGAVATLTIPEFDVQLTAAGIFG